MFLYLFTCKLNVLMCNYVGERTNIGESLLSNPYQILDKFNKICLDKQIEECITPSELSRR
jgi:hypothetical protein